MKLNNTLKSLIFFIIGCIIISGCKNKNSIATIDYEFSGCFASGKSKLVIYKSDNTTFEKLEEPGMSVYKTRLNSLQLDTFKMFITKLKKLKTPGLCTTQEYYTVSFEAENFKRIDGSCDWNGFDHLKKCFFNLPN